MTFIASPQQAAFLDWVSNGTGSCIVEAVAGAGKTDKKHGTARGGFKSSCDRRGREFCR